MGEKTDAGDARYPQATLERDMKRLVVVAFCILFLAGCSPSAPIPKATHAAQAKIVTAQVPDVTGKTVGQVRDDIKAAGFSSIIVSSTDAGVPADDWIVDASLESGKVLDVTTTIRVQAHKPKNTPIPDVNGLTLSAAKVALAAAGLVPDVTASAGDDWIVQSEAPAAGQMAASGDSIALTAQEPPRFVTYTITGNGTANVITYSTDASGSSSQATNVRLPWTAKIPEQGGSFSFYYVSAQDGSGTSITCTITDRNGNVRSTNTASGRYAIAQCSSR
jgi:PBP1b-binding outer membrane lipoprotein LpoB